LNQIADGLWRWTARHPEWHPGEWGSEVGCYALDAGDVLLLVDPLVPERSETLLDDIVRDKPVAILITIPYHTRSAEALRERYDATIHGHPAVAKRLAATQGFEPAKPGDELPGGARPYAIGKPRRQEMPLYLPSHLALAFGDALVTTPEGELRMWVFDKVDAKAERFYRERFAPSLAPLRELDVSRVLVTHGEPLLHDGAKALAAALHAPPWYRGG
jgi:glyoxylase-like metal-dependent hydrolase (beta-lactamase superfamily II)